MKLKFKQIVFDANANGQILRTPRQTNLTKAELIRQSRHAMIYGKYNPTDGNSKRGTAVFNLGGTKQTPFKKDENAPYLHPFYWSPFVLIGNWR